MNVAAIDVGSNAIRFASLRLSPFGAAVGGSYKRYGLRLGSDVFSTGRVGPASADALLRICADIAKRMERLDLQGYRAVATAALRAAKNRRDLVARIRAETGLELGIISGQEEARLAKRALRGAGGAVHGRAVLFDLGAGSLEVGSLASDGLRSLPLGTLRLLEGHPQLVEPTSRAGLRRIVSELCAELEHLLPGASLPPDLVQRKSPAALKVPRSAVGTGGNFRVLAELIPDGDSYLPAIDLGGVEGLLGEMGSLPLTERARRYGLRIDRAELVVPAAVLLLALRRHFGFRKFLAPPTGLREGVLDELCPSGVSMAQARILSSKWGSVGKAHQSLNLGDSLFQSLRMDHGLWEPAMGLLRVVIAMADSGAQIDPAKAAAHTRYLVANLAQNPLEGPARLVAAAAAGAVAAGLGEDVRGLGKRQRNAARSLAALAWMARFGVGSPGLPPPSFNGPRPQWTGSGLKPRWLSELARWLRPAGA